MLEIKFRALNRRFGGFPEAWFRQTFLSEYYMISINPWWFSCILSCFATIENHGSAGTKVSLWQTLSGLKGLMSFPAESFWVCSLVYVSNQIEIIFTEDLKLTCKNTLGFKIWNLAYNGLQQELSKKHFPCFLKFYIQINRGSQSYLLVLKEST